MNEQSEMSDYVVKKASLFTKVSTPIDSSPFYSGDSSELPKKSNKVKPGGLYMMDDTGGVIYQMYNQSAPITLPTATLNLQNMSLTIHSGQVVAAQSFKDQTAFSDTSPFVQFTGDFIIDTLTLFDKDRAPLPDKGQALQVSATTDQGNEETVYIYNVHGKNGQLTIFHNEKPSHGMEGGIKGTKTSVIGQVYVEFGGNLYIGLLNSVSMFIEDPNGVFRVS